MFGIRLIYPDGTRLNSTITEIPLPGEFIRKRADGKRFNVARVDYPKSKNGLPKVYLTDVEVEHDNR